MTTITRQRLKQIYAECEEHDPTIFEIRELVRIALAVPDTLPCAVELKPGLIIGKGCKTETLLTALQRRAALLQGSQPVSNRDELPHDPQIAAYEKIMEQAIPDGWAPLPENCVTAEHRRIIEMLLKVCGAAFELADDSCQQDVDGEECHVVPNYAFEKLSDALDEIENTLPAEDADRPDVFLAWSAIPRAALKSILQPRSSPVIP
ncbi:TPA: hypothetical protein ACXI22_004755 [Citrobacter amalonaticus]|uniref:hypothetical protein n=1 Tax=Citrobacter amalonaticus TaxID=35703 RepID=UPI000B1C8D59|nr:hypothetical protein [Citrobacter amalonaticus]